MFHAGTPEDVKEHIIRDMTNELGNVKVLVCTSAFWMDVNCKNVQRFLNHFGPSKTIESYIQECGRVGRDGKQSSCV